MKKKNQDNLYKGYVSIDNTIIIEPNYDAPIDGKLAKIISTHTRLIFSNYVDNDKKYNVYMKGKYYDTYDFENFKNLKSLYNKPIDGKLPQQIKSLILGWSFNQSADNLPTSLNCITFGHEFNQMVDNLPNTLKYLTFGFKFNQRADNLPNTIEYLSFGFEFNQKVEDLPNGILSIVFGELFSYSLNCLPTSTKFITIKNRYTNSDTERLPKSLEEITFVIGSNDWKNYCREYKLHYEEYFIEKYNLENISWKFCRKINTY